MDNQKITLFAVAMLAVAGVAGLVVLASDSDESAASYSGYGTVYTVNLAPGFSYTYAPTYPSDLTVTTTIEKYESTGINASFSSGTLTVTVKDGITSGSYDIILKATSNTAGLSQTAYQHIRINVVSGLSVSGSINDIIKGAAVNFTPSGTSTMGDVVWKVKSGTTLPAGLTLSNGKVSGTPTTLGVNTVSLTATAAGESKDLVVSFTVYSKIVGGSAQTIVSHGNTVSSTAISNGSDIKVTWKVTSGTLPSGFALNSSTGVVSGSSTVKQSVTVTLTGTSGAGPSQTATKQITIKSEPNLAISGGSSVITYPGAAAKTLTLTGTSGTSAQTWTVSSATGVSISSSGVLSVTNAASSGTVTVTLATEYGQTATKKITITKEAAAAITGSATFSKTTAANATSVYTSNVSGTWSVVSTGAPTGTTVTMDNGTLTLAGSSPTDAFTVVVKCVTPGGQTAQKTVTCQIVSPLGFSSVPSSGIIAYEG